MCTHENDWLLVEYQMHYVSNGKSLTIQPKPQVSYKRSSLSSEINYNIATNACQVFSLFQREGKMVFLQTGQWKIAYLFWFYCLSAICNLSINLKIAMKTLYATSLSFELILSLKTA